MSVVSNRGRDAVVPPQRVEAAEGHAHPPPPAAAAAATVATSATAWVATARVATAIAARGIPGTPDRRPDLGNVWGAPLSAGGRLALSQRGPHMQGMLCGLEVPCQQAEERLHQHHVSGVRHAVDSG